MNPTCSRAQPNTPRDTQTDQRVLHWPQMWISWTWAKDEQVGCQVEGYPRVPAIFRFKCPCLYKATNPAGPSLIPSWMKSARFPPFLRLNLGNHSISLIFCNPSSFLYRCLRLEAPFVHTDKITFCIIICIIILDDQLQDVPFTKLS